MKSFPVKKTATLLMVGLLLSGQASAEIVKIQGDSGMLTSKGLAALAQEIKNGSPARLKGRLIHEEGFIRKVDSVIANDGKPTYLWYLVSDKLHGALITMGGDFVCLTRDPADLENYSDGDLVEFTGTITDIVGEQKPNSLWGGVYIQNTALAQCQLYQTSAPSKPADMR
jgi:hypothetical protein